MAGLLNATLVYSVAINVSFVRWRTIKINISTCTTTTRLIIRQAVWNAYILEKPDPLGKQLLALGTYLWLTIAVLMTPSSSLHLVIDLKRVRN
jgi:hypothetical protein